MLTVYVDGNPQQVVLKALQRHPYKPLVLHIDLLRITGKEKIVMQVPLHFLNEQSAPGVKAIVSHLLTTVEVRCLPDCLPEYIEADLGQLNLDEVMHLSDLTLPKAVELAFRPP